MPLGDVTGEKVSKETYAYTPGLKVKEAAVISKSRRLPLPGEVCIKVGETVNYDTIVARTKISGEPVIVPVTVPLQLEPERILGYMKKKVGDSISQGEVIAGYDAFLGLLKRQVVSPVSGAIESISDATGQVIVRMPPIPVEVDAYLPGEVVEILPREGAVIRTNVAVIQGIFGLGGENHGKIVIVAESPGEELTENHIESKHRGAVLVGCSLVTLGALRKAVEVGVSCIVAAGVRHRDITTFIGEEIGVAITGQENLKLTLIITEGFGRMEISRRTFELLKHFEGNLACVNGVTQIRAGVIRPEILIPHNEKREQSPTENHTTGMVLGTPVRIIRQPYFGAIGRIVTLPVEIEQVESESFVRVARVQLEDGKIVTVPRANLEIIEE